MRLLPELSRIVVDYLIDVKVVVWSQLTRPPLADLTCFGATGRSKN
jgi:hypothetical protein